MTAARSQLMSLGPMGGTQSCSLDFPAPEGCRVRGTSVCCPARGHCPQPLHGAAVLGGVGMAGHTLGLAEGPGCRPRTTGGLCTQLPVSSMIYLSVCIDNQRINDLFFHLVVCSKRGSVCVLLWMLCLVAATLGSVWRHMPYRNSFVASGQITQGPWSVTIEGTSCPHCAYLLGAQIQHPVGQHFISFDHLDCY